MFASTLRHRVACATGLLIFPGLATQLGAQEESLRGAQAHRGWTISVTPQIRKLAQDLAGTHIWSGGLAASVERSLTPRWSVEGGVHGMSAPQLNFRDAARVNMSGLSAAVLWRAASATALSPFVRAGIEGSRFAMDEPPVGTQSSAQFTSIFVGGGVRYAFTSAVQWSSDAVLHSSSYGRGIGFRTGLVLPIGGRSRVADERIAQEPVVRHDTVVVVVIDTVERFSVRTDTIARVDTVVVHETTERTVPGDDVILTLKDASFDFGRSNLRPEAIPMLDALASELTASSTSPRIRIVGHTDDVGSESSNRALGLARATAVKAYLRTRGVAADRIDVDSGGEEFPIATNATESGRQLNRRVIISRSR